MDDTEAEKCGTLQLHDDEERHIGHIRHERFLRHPYRNLHYDVDVRGNYHSMWNLQSGCLTCLFAAVYRSQSTLYGTKPLFFKP